MGCAEGAPEALSKKWEGREECKMINDKCRIGLSQRVKGCRAVKSGKVGRTGKRNLNQAPRKERGRLRRSRSPNGAPRLPERRVTGVTE